MNLCFFRKEPQNLQSLKCSGNQLYHLTDSLIS